MNSVSINGQSDLETDHRACSVLARTIRILIAPQAHWRGASYRRQDGARMADGATGLILKSGADLLAVTAQGLNHVWCWLLDTIQDISSGNMSCTIDTIDHRGDSDGKATLIQVTANPGKESEPGDFSRPDATSWSRSIRTRCTGLRSSRSGTEGHVAIFDLFPDQSGRDAHFIW